MPLALRLRRIRHRTAKGEERIPPRTAKGEERIPPPEVERTAGHHPVVADALTLVEPFRPVMTPLV